VSRYPVGALGGMAERTNARLLKSRETQVSVGSNPTPSAGQRLFMSIDPVTKIPVSQFHGLRYPPGSCAQLRPSASRECRRHQGHGVHRRHGSDAKAGIALAMASDADPWPSAVVIETGRTPAASLRRAAQVVRDGA